MAKLKRVPTVKETMKKMQLFWDNLTEYKSYIDESKDNLWIKGANQMN